MCLHVKGGGGGGGGAGGETQTTETDIPWVVKLGLQILVLSSPGKKHVHSKR